MLMYSRHERSVEHYFDQRESNEIFTINGKIYCVNDGSIIYEDIERYKVLFHFHTNLSIVSYNHNESFVS